MSALKVCDAGKLSFVFGGAAARSPDFWNLVLYLKLKWITFDSTHMHLILPLDLTQILTSTIIWQQDRWKKFVENLFPGKVFINFL